MSLKSSVFPSELGSMIPLQGPCQFARKCFHHVKRARISPVQNEIPRGLARSARECALGPFSRASSSFRKQKRPNLQSTCYAPYIIRSSFTSAKKHAASSAPLASSSAAPSEPAPYTPPTTGLLSHLPSSWVPYAELIRLDKPTGTYYLFFPCLFSTLLAAPLASPITPPLTVAAYSALFLTGALVMRGAGCTINDIWDRNLDPHVARTRLRPLARGAITPFQASVFTGAQALAGLAVLLQFPTACLAYGIPSLALVVTYPLAKRVTHYPQVVLGLTFSWGACMGFPALGVDLLANGAALWAAGCLYSSCVAWTVLYDMIYAHMDIGDDAKAGIKSIALRHERETKVVLSGLAAVQVGLLAAAGVMAGAGEVFFLGSCGGAVGTLGWMIWRVRLESVADCWWWFRNGAWFTGGAIGLGLLGDYMVKLVRADEAKHDERGDLIEA